MSTVDRDRSIPLSPGEVFVIVNLCVGKTWAPADRLRNSILLRGVAPEHKPEVQRLIMAAHREHLRWVTLTQRKWQSKTRNPNKARHHDSISIREQYVRTKQ